MSFGGNTGGGQAQTVNVQPYAPAQGSLNQIISEAGNIYGQGVSSAGYVAPTQQTKTGLAQQEALAGAANTQITNTLAGNYLNPYLSPMLQNATSEIANSINSEFSGAGRTPGSAMNQSQIIGEVADYALPLAFNQYNVERQNQLGLATQLPNMLTTGQQIEQLERQKNLAPFQALQQYGSIISPIASGLPVQQTQTNNNPNIFTQALGGALVGNKIGGDDYGTIGGVAGAVGGVLAGLL
jgi:hypothetical protein